MLLAKILSKILKKESGIVLIDYSGQKYICGNPKKDNPLTIKLLKDNLIKSYKSFFLIDLSFLIICRDIFIISFQPLASLLFIDRTPHNKDICLLTIIFGDIVIILTLGLTADTNFAVVPELEKAIIAFTDGL